MNSILILTKSNFFISYVLVKKINKKETELNSTKIYKIESQFTKLSALFCPNRFSIQMIHPTRHHAHQPLHKNIKLKRSETKHSINTLWISGKNSRAQFIERKTVFELRNVLKAFHSINSATNKQGQMEIWGRKITTEKTLEKGNVSCKTQAAKTPAMIVSNKRFSKK